MKTIEDYNIIKKWFETFPEPYRTQAITNYDDKYITTCFSATIDTAQKALIKGFHWEDSPQGHEYWNDFYSSLFEVIDERGGVLTEDMVIHAVEEINHSDAADSLAYAAMTLDEMQKESKERFFRINSIDTRLRHPTFQSHIESVGLSPILGLQYYLDNGYFLDKCSAHYLSDEDCKRIAKITFGSATDFEQEWKHYGDLTIHRIYYLDSSSIFASKAIQINEYLTSKQYAVNYYCPILDKVISVDDQVELGWIKLRGKK